MKQLQVMNVNGLRVVDPEQLEKSAVSFNSKALGVILPYIHEDRTERLELRQEHIRRAIKAVGISRSDVTDSLEKYRDLGVLKPVGYYVSQAINDYKEAHGLENPVIQKAFRK